jgi:Amidohydrolase
MIIGREEALGLLARAKGLKDGRPWIDVHASPFEVIYNEFRYEANAAKPGVHSLGAQPYAAPAVGPLKVDPEPERPGQSATTGSSATTGLASPAGAAAAMSIFLYRKVYAHVGAEALGDQMALGGIDRSLLLPVLQPESRGDDEMELVHRLYGGDERFLIGYCVPNGVGEADILPAVRSAVSKYGIRAIKVHPNISGIDLASPAGLGRVEAILDAARLTRLPVVVHGGRSPVVKNAAARANAALANLARVDWRITPFPVIISHAGMMGLSPAEIEDGPLAALGSVLASHDHLAVDISALDLTPLRLVLERVAPDRVVFGSDVFYYSQWGSVVKVLLALTQSFPDAEDRFVRIMAANPARCLPKESA